MKTPDTTPLNSIDFEVVDPKVAGMTASPAEQPKQETAPQAKPELTLEAMEDRDKKFEVKPASELNQQDVDKAAQKLTELTAEKSVNTQAPTSMMTEVSMADTKAPVEIPRDLQKIINYEAPDLDISFYSSLPFINSSSYAVKAIKEVSNGQLGYENSNGLISKEGPMSIEKTQKLITTLGNNESSLREKVGRYVGRVEDRSDRSDDMSFKAALENKVSENKEKGTKIFKAGALVGGIGITAGFAALALTVAETSTVAATLASVGMSAAAVTALGTGLFFGGATVVGVGALAMGGKRLWDKFQEKKALKNYMSAGVAANAKRSFEGLIAA